MKNRFWLLLVVLLVIDATGARATSIPNIKSKVKNVLVEIAQLIIGEKGAPPPKTAEQLFIMISGMDYRKDPPKIVGKPHPTNKPDTAYLASLGKHAWSMKMPIVKTTEPFSQKKVLPDNAMLQVHYLSQFWSENLKKNLNCGPAASETAAAYALDRWPTVENIKKLNELMGHNKLHGAMTGYDELVKASCELYGLPIERKHLTLEQACEYLDNGEPVVVAVKYGLLSERGDKYFKVGHFLTLVGWEPENVLVNDPDNIRAPSASRTYNREEFVKAMAGMNNNCLVGYRKKGALPPEQGRIITGHRTKLRLTSRQMTFNANGVDQRLIWCREFTLDKSDLENVDNVAVMINVLGVEGALIKISVNGCLLFSLPFSKQLFDYKAFGEYKLSSKLYPLYAGKNMLDLEISYPAVRQDGIGVQIQEVTFSLGYPPEPITDKSIIL
ncbi:MAG: C39 family peptidase [bacterium]|nr:C39 family peptidase [bacterium]